MNTENLEERKNTLIKKLEEIKKETKNKTNSKFTCANGIDISINTKSLNKEKDGIVSGEFVAENGCLSLCVGQGKGKGCLNADLTKRGTIWLLEEDEKNHDGASICYVEATNLSELNKLGFVLMP